MKVRLTPRTQQDLREHSYYIAASNIENGAPHCAHPRPDTRRHSPNIGDFVMIHRY